MYNSLPIGYYLACIHMLMLKSSCWRYRIQEVLHEHNRKMLLRCFEHPHLVTWHEQQNVLPVCLRPLFSL
uniref:Uncharacterized protein n=1 Tax=Anguilla anguilla TaxID=7936 RepID=A0A0E9X1M7_ANGAN